jgi:hypothetical protein
MKAGDIVRFHMWEDLVNVDDWFSTPKERIGILIEHNKLMGTAEILYKGEIIKERVQFVEKAGKKDAMRVEKSDELPN